MRITKKIVKEIIRLVGIFLLAATVGWLITFSVSSHAAEAVTQSQVQEVTVSLPLAMLVVIACVIAFSFIMDKVINLYSTKLSKLLQSKTKTSWLKNLIKKICRIPYYIKRRKNPLPAVESRPMFDVAEVRKELKKAEEEYSLLKKHKSFGEVYHRIENSNEKAQASTMSDKDKARSNNLWELAQAVLENLKVLDSLGQVNSQEVIEKDGVRQWGEKTHKEKAQAKIQEIELAMFALMSQHATKISNKIERIEIPKLYELEDLLETSRKEGERLLAIIQSQKTPISHESEFVLSKIVNERIDELWEDYKRAKESYFEKEVKELELGSTNKINPDIVLKEALDDIGAIFKEVEVSIKSSREKKAIDSLMITKEYFNNR